MPSIPTIFFKIFVLLSDAFRSSHHRPLYPLMDKKLLKATGHSITAPPAAYVPGHPLPPTSHLDPQSIPVDALDATRLLLRDEGGAEYIVTACRKEHVRLLYEGEAAVLGRAGMCPLLVDVYAVQSGKKVLVGGAGVDRRERGGGAGWECTCGTEQTPVQQQENREEVKREEVVEEKAAEVKADEAMQDDAPPPAAPLPSAAAASVAAPTVESKQPQQQPQQQRVQLSLPEEAPALSTSSSSASSSSTFVRPIPTELLDLPAVSDPLDDGDELSLLSSDLPHALTPSSSTASALASASSSYQQPAHVLTPTHPTSASFQQLHHSQQLQDNDRERSKKKMAAMQRQLLTAQDQLKSVTSMCQLWETKYKGHCTSFITPPHHRPTAFPRSIQPSLPLLSPFSHLSLCCAADSLAVVCDSHPLRTAVTGYHLAPPHLLRCC